MHLNKCWWNLCTEKIMTIGHWNVIVVVADSRKLLISLSSPLPPKKMLLSVFLSRLTTVVKIMQCRSRRVLSDHYMPFLIRKTALPAKTPKSIFVRNDKRYDLNSFLNKLHRAPWSIIQAFNDPADMHDAFSSLSSEMCNECAPIMQRRIKRVGNPWMSKLKS